MIGEFKGFALKNPIRGFAPEPHRLLKKSDKTFRGNLLSQISLSKKNNNG